MSGPDALMLNMETPSTPMHTLKIAVLDPSRRGMSITLAELLDTLPHYLGMLARRSAWRRFRVMPLGRTG